MKEKIDMIRRIFNTDFEIESNSDVEEKVLGDLLTHGTSCGGIYKGRKYMYSHHLIESMPVDKLEAFIKNQLGITI